MVQSYKFKVKSGTARITFESEKSKLKTQKWNSTNNLITSNSITFPESKKAKLKTKKWEQPE